MPPRTVGIAGIGSYLPEDKLTNADLEKMVDTSDQWIVERTGIRERRKCKPEQASSDLAYEAALRAMAEAGVTPDDLNAIIVATISPDMNFPSSACFLQKRLRALNAACWDVSAACSGFLFALRDARALIASGDMNTILVCGAECMTKITNYEDRSSCILFGDGAGAVVLKPDTARHKILDVFTRSDGYDEAAMSMVLRCGGSRSPFSLEALQRKEHLQVIHGREVYKFAVTKLCEVIEQAADRQGVKPAAFDAIIPHQANLRILQGVAERLDIPESKFFVNIDKYGNCSAASVPIALDEAVKQGVVRDGHLIVLATFGAGLTWASATLRW